MWNPGIVAEFIVLGTPATHRRSARGTTKGETHTHTHTCTETYTRHGSTVSESVCESHPGYAASWFYNSRQHGTAFNIPNNCSVGLWQTYINICIHCACTVYFHTHLHAQYVIWPGTPAPMRFRSYIILYCRWVRGGEEGFLTSLCVRSIGEPIIGCCTTDTDYIRSDLWITLAGEREKI